MGKVIIFSIIVVLLHILLTALILSMSSFFHEGKPYKECMKLSVISSSIATVSLLFISSILLLLLKHLLNMQITAQMVKGCLLITHSVILSFVYKKVSKSRWPRVISIVAWVIFIENLISMMSSIC